MKLESVRWLVKISLYFVSMCFFSVVTMPCIVALVTGQSLHIYYALSLISADFNICFSVGILPISWKSQLITQPHVQ